MKSFKQHITRLNEIANVDPSTPGGLPHDHHKSKIDRINAVLAINYPTIHKAATTTPMRISINHGERGDDNFLGTAHYDFKSISDGAHFVGTSFHHFHNDVIPRLQIPSKQIPSEEFPRQVRAAYNQAYFDIMRRTYEHLIEASKKIDSNVKPEHVGDYMQMLHDGHDALTKPHPNANTGKNASISAQHYIYGSSPTKHLHQGVDVQNPAYHSLLTAPTDVTDHPMAAAHNIHARSTYPSGGSYVFEHG
jgi:uncharacterized protein YnzC (UPF0291/DUF896 family)